MMMLEHPHVVKLEEVLESASTVFFVMELCGGGSLYELMDNTVCHVSWLLTYTHRPCLSQWRDFFMDRLSAPSPTAILRVQCNYSVMILTQLVGICHRDLKLDNVLLYDNKTIKITDFGHAGIFSEGWDIFQTALVGGITHIAPEQVWLFFLTSSVDA